MNSLLQIPKTASGKNSPSCTFAPGRNRPQSRAASRVWSRRRQNCVGVICYADHLGTPRAITRPSDNAVVWRWENTDPFGANLPNENPSGLGAFAFNLRFPGQYYDAETGTHYNYFRDYDPSTGRYVQSDPIGLVGGINSYAYVSGRPTSLIDPFGLCEVAVWSAGYIVGWKPCGNDQPQPSPMPTPDPQPQPPWPGRIDIPTRIPPDSLVYPKDAPNCPSLDSNCFNKCRLAAIGSFVFKEFTLDLLYGDAIPEVASAAAKNNSRGQRMFYKGVGAGSKGIGKFLLISGAWELGTNGIAICEKACTR